jgi:hypothetical protein
MNLTARALTVAREMRDEGPAHYAANRAITFEDYFRNLPSIAAQLRQAYQTATSRQERRATMKAIKIIRRMAETGAEDFRWWTELQKRANAALEQGLSESEYVTRLEQIGRLLLVAIRDVPAESRAKHLTAINLHRELMRRAPEDFALAAEASRQRKTKTEGGN